VTGAGGSIGRAHAVLLASRGAKVIVNDYNTTVTGDAGPQTESTAFKSTTLSGKVAFVAGGSSGINLGIAERLAEVGAKVALISRKAEKLERAVAQLSALGHQAMGVTADVRDFVALEKAFAKACDRWGAIDLVISGAAGNFLAPAIGLSPNAFKTVIDIDLLGTFNVFRASWERLRKPGASLIAITAGQAVNPMAFQAHACAAKAGVNMLVKCLALEWGPAGVRVNAISPGPISGTEGMDRLTPTAEAVDALKQRIPLRNYGTKRNVGDMAVFLCSDAAVYVTGSIFNVDGGAELGDASADPLVAHR
jgi:NAD(P)-dependent dehydrogenase (short-subunit alcohol dehydrogenase family)